MTPERMAELERATGVKLVPLDYPRVVVRRRGGETAIDVELYGRGRVTMAQIGAIVRSAIPDVPGSGSRVADVPARLAPID